MNISEICLQFIHECKLYITHLYIPMKKGREEMDLIFDSHAHYDDEQFDKDRHELLLALNRNGVGAILNMSSDYDSIKTTVELTKTYDFRNVRIILKNYPHGQQKLEFPKKIFGGI